MQGFHSLVPITPQIMNSNHAFICDSHHKERTSMDVLLGATLTSEYLCWKIPSTLTPAPYWAGAIWYRCVTRAFIVSLCPPFYNISPIPARHIWQRCSLTGKAILSAPWQQIACCTNRFVGPPAGAQCSSLCCEAAHPFLTACFIFNLRHTLAYIKIWYLKLPSEYLLLLYRLMKSWKTQWK